MTKSSANNNQNDLFLLNKHGISFINKLKRVGLRTDPSGTPHLIDLKGDEYMPILTQKVLFSK